MNVGHREVQGRGDVGGLLEGRVNERLDRGGDLGGGAGQGGGRKRAAHGAGLGDGDGEGVAEINVVHDDAERRDRAGIRDGSHREGGVRGRAVIDGADVKRRGRQRGGARGAVADRHVDVEVVEADGMRVRQGGESRGEKGGRSGRGRLRGQRVGFSAGDVGDGGPGQREGAVVFGGLVHGDDDDLVVGVRLVVIDVRDGHRRKDRLGGGRSNFSAGRRGSIGEGSGGSAVEGRRDGRGIRLRRDGDGVVLDDGLVEAAVGGNADAEGRAAVLVGCGGEGQGAGGGDRRLDREERGVAVGEGEGEGLSILAAGAGGPIGRGEGPGIFGDRHVRGGDREAVVDRGDVDLNDHVGDRFVAGGKGTDAEGIDHTVRACGMPPEPGFPATEAAVGKNPLVLIEATGDDPLDAELDRIAFRIRFVRGCGQRRVGNQSLLILVGAVDHIDGRQRRRKCGRGTGQRQAGEEGKKARWEHGSGRRMGESHGGESSGVAAGTGGASGSVT